MFKNNVQRVLYTSSFGISCSIQLFSFAGFTASLLFHSKDFSQVAWEVITFAADY